MDLRDITKVAQDYLKTIWSATEWGDPPITTKALAARFGTTPANVSDTVKRLAAQGLVHHEPYRPVTLTAEGSRYALAMVRRHRLLESFLVRELGYTWDEVHDEAESLEHAVSETLVDRIDALLGHPTADPHGDPIPSPEGRIDHADTAVRLADAHAGGHVVVRVSDADPEQLAWFSERGVVPGSVVRVDEQDDHRVVRVVRVGQHQLALDPDLAGAVWVAPA